MIIHDMYQLGIQKYSHIYVVLDFFSYVNQLYMCVVVSKNVVIIVFITL